MDSSQEDQLYWAKILKMDPSQFNKYCNGTERVGPKALERLLAVLPRASKGTLLAAYLLDQVPAGEEALVRVEPRMAALAEPEVNILEGLDDDKAEALRWVASRIREKHFFDLLDKLRRALVRERGVTG